MNHTSVNTSNHGNQQDPRVVLLAYLVLASSPLPLLIIRALPHILQEKSSSRFLLVFALLCDGVRPCFAVCESEDAGILLPFLFKARDGRGLDAW